MDAWRFIAALLVVVSHARDVAMQPYGGQLALAPFYAMTGFGHSAVILFFVLSGFWISRSALGRIHAPDFWKRYLLDRLTRLLIVLIPALALGGLLDWLGSRWLNLPIYSGGLGILSLPEDIGARLDLRVAAGNLAFLQTIAVPPFGTNGPLWSLAWEFWFYLWFAAGAVLLIRRRFSFALLSLLVGYFNVGIVWGFCAWMVGFGLLLAVQQGGAWPILRGVKAWIAGSLALSVFLAVLAFSRRADSQFFDFVLAISFAVLLYASLRLKLPFPESFDWMARYGRNSSFSLYVIHFPVLIFAGGWLLGTERFAPGLFGVCATVALTAVCVFLAWLFSLVTEGYTNALRGKLTQLLA